METCAQMFPCPTPLWTTVALLLSLSRAACFARRRRVSLVGRGRSRSALPRPPWRHQARRDTRMRLYLRAALRRVLSAVAGVLRRLSLGSVSAASALSPLTHLASTLFLLALTPHSPHSHLTSRRCPPQMLMLLAGPHTTILVGLERRPGDGAAAFFTSAAAEGFETTLRLQRNRVVVCEMRRAKP